MKLSLEQIRSLILTPEPELPCAVCGHMTRETLADIPVCGNDDDDSLACKEVLDERISRSSLPHYSDDAASEQHEPIERRRHFRDERDHFDDYRSYIASYEWQIKAFYAKARAGYRCQKCGSKGHQSSLHTHHLHYKTLYHERRSDVLVLCGNCHRREHKK